MPKIDTNLFQFCTVRQLEKLEAWEKHGSSRKAAKALGLSKNAIDGALQDVKKKAAEGNKVATVECWAKSWISSSPMFSR